MNRAQEEELSKTLVAMSENFGKPISQALLAILLDELGQYPLETVMGGLMKIMRARKYSSIPPLAEILEAIGATPDSEDAQIKAQAEAQWVRLLNMPSGASYHREFLGRDAEGNPIYAQPEDHLDPVARIAFRAMGESKAAWTDANLDFKRRMFLDLYAHHAKGPLALPAPKSAKVIEMARRIG